MVGASVELNDGLIVGPSEELTEVPKLGEAVGVSVESNDGAAVGICEGLEALVKDGLSVEPIDGAGVGISEGLHVGNVEGVKDST
jgi:hypothetical protein